MHHTIRNLLAASSALFIAGCASTTIYPEGNNRYSLVTTSSEQSFAEKDAKKKAEKYCTDLGKNLVVISHKSEYHGVSKDSSAMIGLASAILTDGMQNPAKSNSDYEVTMKFTCN